MTSITGNSERNIVIITLVVSCILSSVCSNIGVMVALAPLVTAMCISAKVGPSRALLSLLFGAQLGGFITLVGVGSNAAASALMVDLGFKSFGFFDITPFGIGVSIVGILYFVFIGMKVLPDTGYIPDFAQVEKKELNKKKAIIASIIMSAVLVVIAVGFKAVPMHVAAVLGACAIVAFKCMSLKDAYGAIDWSCLILVGALSVLSEGVKNSGAGSMLANYIISVLGDNPSPFLITTVIFWSAALLTQIMSNIPTILIFLPIGTAIATHVGISPYPVAMVITLAGAASYATPFAAPQNMMTVGWTNYKFLDFMKIGFPMVFLTYVVIAILIPFVMPY